ncbi:MAG: fumarylacetoacetate hydrolase family protein, partial [Planctomycetales bacterium]|nr:fumarylacetoacetate hydrolase family protein [Planctomycetales bacterium]
MRLIHHQTPAGPRVAALRAAVAGEEVVDLHAVDATLPSTVDELLRLGAEGLARAAAAAEAGPASPWDAGDVLAPVLAPPKIICVGLNYADHAAETGAKVGDEPVIFNKFPTTLRGPGDAIELPPESSQVDFEAELVVVIGQPCRRVDRAAAWEHIAGYACGHDVSARDWQKGKPGKQWLLGKSFDSFAPLGPWLATRDEIADPGDLAIQMRLNGQVMQHSNTRNLIFPIDYLVSYLSHVCTLLPGDLIYTGTPAGVGPV